MANKRMFSMDVIDTDKFLEMPATSQNLYFHLGMRADDDGFISNPKKITKLVNCGNDDLNVLISRGFVITFEDGIIVIRHWKQNNYLRGDRYKETIYQNQKKMLVVKDGVYDLNSDGIPMVDQMDTNGIPVVDKMDTQYSIDKNSIDKYSNIYSVHFDEFWNAYPRKKEKAKAYKAYNARLKDGFSEEELLTAAKEYAKECDKDKREQKYIKLGSTFLGSNTPFMDYLVKDNEKGDRADEQSSSSTKLWE
jgi:hypothetical protein